MLLSPRIISHPFRNYPFSLHFLTSFPFLSSENFTWKRMKFGKSLSNQTEETLPEWKEKFLSYKDLKKRLNLIEPKSGAENGAAPAAKRPRLDGVGGGGEEEVAAMTKEESDFIELLESEIEKFNGFFVEKEEEYIIRLKDFKDRVAKAKDSSEEMIKIWKEIVDFHGEMVLLENYSALNYTGLVKILKKYDKRTGALIRSPYIQKVLHEPFFTTDLLYKLVKECEALLDRLFPINKPPTSTDKRDDGDEPSTSAEIEYMESLYVKSTISALRALKEIRSKSSTVSMFSLPPLQNSGVEDTWFKVPVLEQEAK